MNAYAYNADMWCEDCALKVIGSLTLSGVIDNGDTDTFPQGPFPNGGGESDSPRHCCECHEFLENPLTSDGIEFLKEVLERNGNLPKEWLDQYRDVLPRESETE